MVILAQLSPLFWTTMDKWNHLVPEVPLALRRRQSVQDTVMEVTQRICSGCRIVARSLLPPLTGLFWALSALNIHTIFECLIPWCSFSFNFFYILMDKNPTQPKLCQLYKLLTLFWDGRCHCDNSVTLAFEAEALRIGLPECYLDPVKCLKLLQINGTQVGQTGKRRSVPAF